MTPATPLAGGVRNGHQPGRKERVRGKSNGISAISRFGTADNPQSVQHLTRIAHVHPVIGIPSGEYPQLSLKSIGEIPPDLSSETCSFYRKNMV
jgi:hypothetical protein